MSHPPPSRRLFHSYLAGVMSGALLLTALLHPSPAQVRTALTPDGSLGTAVTLQPGNVYAITGGRRPGNGPNLFHSFERFSVGTGDTASFQGPAGITNVLSRVTGGQVSEIDGKLQSTIPGANLYLLNPSGVLFGPNARLDVSGSFHVSTADYLRLADGARFAARLSDTTTLSVAPPEAFGFLRDTPADITLNKGSELWVSEEATLAIVGGNIQIRGSTLAAPQGRVTVVSVAAPGEVNPHGGGQAVQALPRLGAIEISNGALLDTSGEGGGTITIRGGRLLVDTATLASDTRGRSPGAPTGIDIQVAGDVVIKHGGDGTITVDTVGPGNAGAFYLMAERVQIETSTIGSRALSTGKAGAVTVQAQAITLSDNAQISGSSSGAGQGGPVTVTATETLTLRGTSPDGPSGIFATTNGSGAAGSIDVQARNIMLSDGALISGSTFGAGAGGQVTIRAAETFTMRDSVVFANAGEGTRLGAPTGDAGSVTVQARHVLLSDGAQIGTGTFGPGHGGPVTVMAAETLTLQGTSPEGLPTGVFVLTAGAGNAGTVTVRARDILLRDGAQITLDTYRNGKGGAAYITATETLTMTGTGVDPGGTFPSGILASTQGGNANAGAAGTIDVRARNVLLSDGAQITSNTSGGQGGRVTVTATETLTLRGTSADGTLPSGLATRARGVGVAGIVDVQARDIVLRDGAQISGITRGSGQGGTVKVTATETLTLTGHSGIAADTSSEERGAGDAGAVSVHARDILLSDGAQIGTTATVADGGNIQLRTQGTLRLRDSQITTAVGSGQGRGGNIAIDSDYTLLERSQIRADAFGGPGGNIRLVARGLLADADSRISASSRQNVDGRVDIQAVTTPSGLVTPPPPDFPALTALLRDPCAARLQEGHVSSLVVRERESTPAAPDGVLPGRLYAGVPQERHAPRGRQARGQRPPARPSREATQLPPGTPGPFAEAAPAWVFPCGPRSGP